MLQQIGINSIVFVVAATNNSIESRIRTAGNLRLNVFVVKDASFTFEKKDYFGTTRSLDVVDTMSLAILNGEYKTVLSSSNFLKIINKI